MSLFTYLSFSISPLLILLLVLYLKFKFSIQNFSNIRSAVIWGIISIVFIVIGTYAIESVWHGNLRNMRRMAFFVFVIVAFGSEFAKFLVLRGFFYKKSTFEGPLEGVIYSIFISLGFSAIAVPLYAYGIIGTDAKFNDITLFLYTYPLASIVFGVVLGFFIGMGKLRKNWLIDNSTGLFASTFFHGLFYFCFITADKRLLIITSIGFLVIAATLIAKAANLRASKD